MRSDRTPQERLPADPPDEQNGDIADLISLVGPRPAVPPERMARAREIGREHWRRELRGRTTRRRLWAAAAVGVAAALLVAAGLRIQHWRELPPAEAPTLARAESVVGAVWNRPAGGVGSALRRGDSVLAGSEVATDVGGRVALTMGSGRSLRLDDGTRIRMVSDSQVALERGGVYIDSGPARLGEAPAVEIRTKLGVVRDIGTQFEVRWQDGSVRVRVREGSVVVEGDEGTHAVAAGSELKLDDGGIVSRGDVAVHGPDWSWTENIAPMLDLEGRSLRSFLDWISRERGWRLGFYDGVTEHAAAETILNGSAEGLSLDEALQAVLPACRMTHRVDRGALEIRRMADIEETE